MKQGAPEPIAALNRVRILENGEPLVDIRLACPHLLVSEKACPWLRVTVADMAEAACISLEPLGLRLRAGTALRTVAVQKRHYDGYYQRMEQEHPEWPRSALRRAANRYFAPYDQSAPPGHCTGGAIDVELVGPDGAAMDVNTPYERWDGAYTWVEGLTPQAHANRQTLVQAMLGAGFSNCRDEYWHYSFGDSAWAVRTGASECPYGLALPPEGQCLEP